MEMSREHTPDEVTNRVLDHIWTMIRYWEKVEGIPWEDKMSGLAFSILTMLDGHSASLPKFIVAPDPHPEDRAYHIKNGGNYWPENYEAKVLCDIAGGLHDRFYYRLSQEDSQ